MWSMKLCCHQVAKVKKASCKWPRAEVLLGGPTRLSLAEAGPLKIRRTSEGPTWVSPQPPHQVSPGYKNPIKSKTQSEERENSDLRN